jgi:type I restriction enzyme S subunit
MVLSDVPNGSALASCYLVDEKNLYTLNQRICSINSRRFDPRFLYYQLNRNSYFLAFDNGENQTNLRLGQVLDCPLYLPDISEQKAIAQSLHVVRAETEKLESNYQNKLASLHKLRQSIFHKAFRGGFESAQSLATPQAAE